MPLLLPPDVLPTWATQDLVDPTSGQNNVETPPDQAQQFGWSFQQYPPRNWFNWLSRWTYNWLNYLKQNDSKSRTVITFAPQGGGDSDGPIVPLPMSSYVGTNPIVMIYIQDTNNVGSDKSCYVGMWPLNTVSSTTPIQFAALSPGNNYITTGQVDKTTGILTSVNSSQGGTVGPFNIVAVSYDTLLSF
jgi:hypothetical protein